MFVLYMLCNRQWRDKPIHGEREGVTSLIMLCCVVILAKSLEMPHLRAFPGGLSLLPSAGVVRHTRHSHIPPLPAMDAFSISIAFDR